MCFKKIETLPVPKPVLRSEITGAGLRAILQEKFPNCQNIYISDGDDELISLCDLSDIQKMLAQDETNKGKYKRAFYDCDDFAYRLFGQFNTEDWGAFAIGVMWTNLHALVWVLDSNLDFWYLEPQNDQVQSKLEEWQGTDVFMILV